MYDELFKIDYLMPLTDRFCDMMETAQAAFMRLKDEVHETNMHAECLARMYGYSSGPFCIPNDVVTALCISPERLSKEDRRCLTGEKNKLGRNAGPHLPHGAVQNWWKAKVKVWREPS